MPDLPHRQNVRGLNNSRLGDMLPANGLHFKQSF